MVGAGADARRAWRRAGGTFGDTSEGAPAVASGSSCGCSGGATAAAGAGPRVEETTLPPGKAGGADGVRRWPRGLLLPAVLPSLLLIIWAAAIMGAAASILAGPIVGREARRLLVCGCGWPTVFRFVAHTR